MRWKWAKVGSAVVVVATAVMALMAAVEVLTRSSDAEPKPEPKTSLCPFIIGDHARTEATINVNCDYIEQVKSIQQLSEEQALERSRQFAHVPPKGPGPWPFQVLGTEELGLKVRTTNVLEGKQIGAVPPRNTVWALCKANSGWDPDPSTGNGPIWLKIKWEHRTPSTEFFQSDPAATSTAWVYGAYAKPVGHNGNIPLCS